MALDKGYFYIERGEANAMQLQMKKWQIFVKYEPFIEDIPDEEYVSISLKIVNRMIVLRDIFFKTKSDAETFLDKINTLNGAGGMTCELRTSSSAIPGSFFNFISGKTAIEMFCLDITPMEKVAYGDEQVYKIAILKFRQSEKFA